MDVLMNDLSKALELYGNLNHFDEVPEGQAVA